MDEGVYTDNFGESFVLTSDNSYKDTNLEVGKKYLIKACDAKEDNVSSKKFEIELRVARILATQYYLGWSSSEKCNMKKDEYINKSLHNWVSAARGIISFVDMERKKITI